MGDRRMGDRRAPEEGVIKLQKKDVIIFGVIALVLIISLTMNIVLTILYNKYKNQYEESFDSEITEEDSDVQESERSVNNTCDLYILIDKKEVKAGETVTYNLSANNIVADSGIVMFETRINYDSNLFDCKVENNEESEWQVVSSMDNYVTTSRKDLEGKLENQNVAVLHFTAKQDVLLTEETITFSNTRFTMDNNQSFEIDSDWYYYEFPMYEEEQETEVIDELKDE